MNAIEIRNMYKDFKLVYDKPTTLKERICFWKTTKVQKRQVLKNINLDIKKGETVALIGTNGSGKSTLLKLMTKILYPNKGTLETELKKIERCRLLILDDAFLVPVDAKERPILLDIIEDRHERKSIIISSQLPVDNWYDAIGDPTVADAVLDRIVHSSYQIELTGESLRKIKAKNIGR